MGKREKFSLKGKKVIVPVVTAIMSATIFATAGIYVNAKKEVQNEVVQPVIPIENVVTPIPKTNFEKLEQSQFEINIENKTISFSEDIKAGSFCISESLDVPTKEDTWQTVKANDVIQLKEVDDEKISNANVYYMADTSLVSPQANTSAQLMQRESGINGTENYAIGAKRAGKTQYTGDKIKTITLQNNLTAPIGYVDTWDASYNQDGTVTAWVVPSTEDTAMYDLYLGGNNGLVAPTNGYMLFAFYTKCTQINNFNLLDTSLTTNMRGFFYRMYELKSIDLSYFSTINSTNMWDMFSDCQSLTMLDLTNFDTSKLIYTTYMFYNCKNVTKINLSANFAINNVTDMSGMFYQCINLTNVDVSNFTTSKVTNMSSMFRNCSKLTNLNVSNFNTTNVTNMSNMFRGCSSLTSLDVSNFNTINVTDIGLMFDGCMKLTTLDLTNWNTSKVGCMGGTFRNCTGLKNINLAGFDTSSVYDMTMMFYGCTSLTSLDLSSFVTSELIDLSNMFENCTSLTSLDLSTFDLSNTDSMEEVFKNCGQLISINLGINFNQLAGNNIFSGCSNLKAIITQSTTVMLLMSDTALTTGLKTLTNAVLYVPSVEAESTFEADANYADIFGADRIRPILELVGDNPAKVKLNGNYVDAGVTIAGFTKAESGEYTQYGYDYVTSGLPVDTTTTGTKQVTYTLTKTENSATTNGMSVTRDVKVVGVPKLMWRESYDSVNGKVVYYAIGAKRSNNKKYTSDLINSITFVNNVNVPTEAEASWDASYTNGDNEVIAWVIPNATDSTKYDLYIGVDDTKIEAPENSFNLFGEYKNCTAINNLTMLDTSNVTNMRYMFSRCSSLTNLDVSNFDTLKVTDMNRMFLSCNSLPSLDVSNFNTSNVTNMASMFNSCSSLPSLDVSNFDTSKVTDMSDMFSSCRSLISLDVSTFDTSNVTNMSCMFYSCSSLTSLDVSNFDTSKVTNRYSMFFCCSNLTSVNLGANFDRLTGTNMFSGCSRLKAIITPRTSIMTLNDEATTSTGLKTLTNAVLYVPTVNAETTFEADANYADIFGADRIRPIIELVGDNPAKVANGATYVDSGATVAGMTENADDTYTPYEYRVSGPVIKKGDVTVTSIDTSTKGTYTYTYTVVDPDGVSGMSVTRTVEIESRDISENNLNITVTLPTEERVYKDAEYRPVVTVKDGTKTLTENTDFTVSYSDNINAGMATITITGINNYTGSRTENFMITQRPITVKPKDATKVYDTLPLTSNVVEVTAGSLVSGHTVMITTSGSITNVGSVDNTISTLTIKNASGTDVTVNYNVTKAKGTLTITSAGSVDFDITLNNNTFEYDGTAKEPTATVKVGNTTLTEGTDYEVSYKNNKDAGTATVTITGKGNYEGSIGTKEFTITKRVIEITAGSATKTYDGTALTSSKFEVTSGSLAPNQTLSITTSGSITNVGSTPNKIATYKVMAGSEDVTKNYTVTTVDGTLTVTSATITGSVKITGNNIYGETLTAEVTVVPADCTLTYAWYMQRGQQRQTITGATNSTLVLGSDQVGKIISVQVTAQKTNYNSRLFTDMTDVSTNGSSTVLQKDLTSPDIVATISPVTFVYSGAENKPTVTLYDNTTLLAENTDYTVSYSNNIEVGTGIVTITGMGNYKGSIEKQFTITKASVTPKVNMTGYTYGGAMSTPSVTGNTGNGTVTYYYNTTNSNTNGTNWSTVTSSTSLNAGTYYMYAVIGATTNYNEATTAAVSFVVAKRDVTIKPKDVTKVYDTLPLTSNVAEVTAGSLVSGHTVTITTTGSITNVGSTENTISTLTIKNASGTDVTANYNVTKAKGTLTITSAGSVDFDITLNNNTFEYDGTAKEPTATVKVGSKTLVAGTDYEVSYKNNKDAGTATVTITGKGNYAGSIGTKEFTITKRVIEITAGSATKTYDGTALTSSKFEVTSGSLAPNQTLSVTTSGSITNVGTTPNKVATYKVIASSEDVTKNYTVTTVDGTLTITNSKITGSVEITGITKVLEVLVANTINVNPVGCTYEYNWYYNDTKDMTGGTLINNANERRFTVTEDLIGKYIYVEVTVSKAGHGTEVFKDITDEVISKSGSTENPGSGETEIEVKRRPITIKLVDKEKIYDGTPLTSDEFIVSSGELVLGDKATVVASGERTDVGTSINEITSVVIKNVGNEDVTEKYIITKENGTLTVKAKNNAIFNITLDKDTFEYDDTAKEPDVTVVSDGKTLTKGVDYTLTYENNIDAGTATIRIVGIGNYEGSKGSKDFTITRRKITLKAGDATKVYDGTPLTSAEVKVTAGELVAGHILVATTAGSITNVGSVPNKVYTYKITKGNKDVTANYDVTTLDGTLEVTKATIIGSVTIKGTNRVEETLTANVTVTPNDCTLEYAWYYSDTNDTQNGTLITTTTTNKLLLTEEYLDKYIYVVVKASKDNYEDAEFRDITDADENEVPKVGERLESILMAREDDTYVIGAKRAGKTEYISSLIKTINFVDLRKEVAPINFVDAWDVSKEQNGKVTAWIVKNSTDSTKYDLYIGGKDGVKASEGYKLFSNYENLISINKMDVFDTSLVTNMGYMFNGDMNLTSLDLQKFDTDLVTNMSYMFNECKALQTLDVTYLNTTKVTDMAYMFGGMNKLNSIDVTGFVTANVTNISGMFSNCSSLLSLDVSKFNTAKVTDMSNMFSGMSGLTEIDLTNFITSEVTNMSGMFKNNSKLTYLDLNSFDTSKVTNINELLSGNTSLKTIHLGKMFDKVNGENMFANANSLLIIIAANSTPMTLATNINVNGNAILYVPDLTAETAYEADISYMNVFGKDRIKPMLALVGNNPANISINRLYTDDGITVAGYKDANAIEYTRYGYKVEVSGLPVDTSTLGKKTITYTLKDRNGEVVMVITRDVIVNEGPILMAREDEAYAIGAKRANKLTYTSDKIKTITFIDTTTDNIPTTYIDTWDVSKDLNTSVTAWITRNTQDNLMYDLYIGGDKGVIASSGNKLFMDYTNLVSINNISRLDVSSVTDMSYMFANDKKLPSVDISRFTTTKVTDMSFMFKECNTFTTLDVTKLDTSSVTNMESMFEGCSGLTALNVSGFTTTNVLNMKNMFKNVSGINSLTFTNWDTSKVRNMSGLFDGCAKLTSIDLAKLKTPSVTDMSAMFRNCSSIAGLDVTKFDTSSVTNMESMFANVRKVSELDVSGFNTSNVTNMNNMFSNMTSIQTLDLTSFNVKTGSDVAEMFDGMNSMEILVLGTNFNVLDGTNMFNGCNNLTTIITKKNIGNEANAMLLSTDTKLNANAILYVPNETAEGYFEKATNYDTVFGTDRICPILELLGSKNVEVTRNTTYTDKGATVAGFTKAEESKYTSLGYELLGPEITKDGKSISKVDTTVPGTYLVKYTLRLNGTTVMNVTRTVEVVQLTASLVLSRYDLTIVEGNTETVTYTYSGDGTISVTTIANIASAVLKQGSIAITGVSVGNAKIIVKATGIIYNDATAEINITVVKANYSITDKDGNKTNYNTLQDAVDGAESGDTIKVIDDVKETGDIVIDKDVTIDLGDKTITIDTPIKTDDGSNVTIIGSGDDKNIGTIENPDGTAIINDGNLTIGKNTGKDVEDKPHIIGKDTALDSKDGNTKLESGTLTGKDEPPYKGNIEVPKGYYIDTTENGDKFDSVVKKDSTPPLIYGQTLDKILMNAGDTIRFFVYVEDKESGINTNEFTVEDLIFEIDGNKVTPKDVKLEYVDMEGKGVYKYRLTFSGITSDGELVIRVDKDKVFNKAKLGNLETIISQNIISVDSTGPNVTNAIFELIKPEDGTTYDGEFEAKLSNVYDRYGIKRYEWQIKEEDTFAYKTLNIEESNDTSSFYAGTLDKEGTYLLRVAVTDNSGNTSYTKDLRIIYGKYAGYNAKPTISFEKEIIRSGGKVIEVNIHAIVKSTTNIVWASVNDNEINVGDDITIEGKWQIRTELTYKAYANTMYKFSIKDENGNVVTKVYNVSDITRDAASISYKIYDATSFGKARIVFTAEEEVRLVEDMSDKYVVDDLYMTTYRKEITVFVKGDMYSIDDTFVFANKIGNETPVHVLGDIDSNSKNIITVKNSVSRLTEVYGGEITLNRAENLVNKMKNAKVSTSGNISSYYGLSFAQVNAKVTTEKEFTALTTLATSSKVQTANADGSIRNIASGKIEIITSAELDSSSTNGNRTGIYMRENKIITGRERADEDGSKKGNSFHVTIINK